MTAAASGSIRRPRGQCAGGSDPLSTPFSPLPLSPRLFLHLLLLLSTYRPLCSEPEYTGQNRTRLLRLPGETLLLSTHHRRVERNRSGWWGRVGKETGRGLRARERFLPLLNLTSWPSSPRAGNIRKHLGKIKRTNRISAVDPFLRGRKFGESGKIGGCLVLSSLSFSFSLFSDPFSRKEARVKEFRTLSIFRSDARYAIIRSFDIMVIWDLTSFRWIIRKRRVCVRNTACTFKMPAIIWNNDTSQWI